MTGAATTPGWRTPGPGSRPAGTAVRFEPGDAHTVTLVALAGNREVHGLADLTDGPLDPTTR